MVHVAHLAKKEDVKNVLPLTLNDLHSTRCSRLGAKSRVHANINIANEIQDSACCRFKPETPGWVGTLWQHRSSVMKAALC